MRRIRREGALCGPTAQPPRTQIELHHAQGIGRLGLLRERSALEELHTAAEDSVNLRDRPAKQGLTTVLQPPLQNRSGEVMAGL